RGERIRCVVQTCHAQITSRHERGVALRKPYVVADAAQAEFAFRSRLAESESQRAAIRDRHVPYQRVVAIDHLDAVAEIDSRLRLRIFAHARIAIEMVFAEIE